MKNFKKIKSRKKGAYQKKIKRLLWFRFYLDDNNKTTFLNGVESAVAANYGGKRKTLYEIASRNTRYYKDQIQEWLKSAGWTEESVKHKLLKLTKAKETKFFTHQGKIISKRSVAALETRRRSLDMIMKAEDMYSPKKIELTGKQEIEYIMAKQSLENLSREELEDLAKILEEEKEK